MRFRDLHYGAQQAFSLPVVTTRDARCTDVVDQLFPVTVVEFTFWLGDNPGI